jgi:hypothetical protein
LLRNSELSKNLDLMEAEIQEFKHSARLLPDLIGSDSCVERLDQHDDVAQLEIDLYSALRAVIAYRTKHS